MEKNLRKNKAITLVALVITIIILLILAGVAIVILTQTGLLKNAKQAKEMSENAQKLEKNILNQYEQKIDNKRTETRDELPSSNVIEDFYIKAEQVNGAKIEIKIDIDGKINLTDENSSIKGYILYSEDEVLDVFNKIPYYFIDVEPNKTYKDLHLTAIDNKGKIKDSVNKITIDIPNVSYIYNFGQEYEEIQAEYGSSSGTRTKNSQNLYMAFNDTAGDWHYSCYFGMKNKLDVTNLKKIIIHYSELKLAGNTTAAIILSTEKGYYSPSGTIYKKQDNVLDEKNTLTFDVSDLSGSYYLCFGIGSHDKNCSPEDSSQANSYTGTGSAVIDSVIVEYK